MAEIRFAHVGLGDCVCVNHVLAIIQNGSATAKRYQDNAKKLKKYIDATHGKTIKSFLLLDEGTVIASHIRVATLQQRLSYGGVSDTGVERTPPVVPYGSADDDDEDDVEEDEDEGLSE